LKLGRAALLQGIAPRASSLPTSTKCLMGHSQRCAAWGSCQDHTRSNRKSSIRWLHGRTHYLFLLPKPPIKLISLASFSEACPFCTLSLWRFSLHFTASAPHTSGHGDAKEREHILGSISRNRLPISKSKTIKSSPLIPKGTLNASVSSY
jgi:hypothetical protein